MRLTLKDHRDAMVAMLANGNCPTSAARLAHAMHDVLSYLQSEPEAPVSHSERRDEATTPGLNDKLLALDVGALAKPQTVNKRVRKLEATVKARDNTVNQLKENIRLLRDERAELTRQLQEALDREQCLREWLKHIDAGDNEQLTPEQIETIRQASPASSLPEANFTNELFPAQSGVRKEDTELPWIEWDSGPFRPANDKAYVNVRFKNGGESEGFVDQFYWTHPGLGRDITAYRVVKP